MSRRVQNLGLVLLALAAGTLTWLAFANVRGADPGERAESTPARVTADAGQATQEPGAPASLEAAREALAGDEAVVAAVLGDSTSNTRSEWVHLWAEELAGERPVEIVHWAEDGGEHYNEPDVLAEEGAGSPVTLYSASVAGADAAYPASRVEQLVPQQPDFVLLSYGRDDSADRVADGLGETAAALRETYGEQLPVVVVLQPPVAGDERADVRAAVEGWARDNGAGVIEVAGEEQDLWARTVAEALGG